MFTSTPRTVPRNRVDTCPDGAFHKNPVSVRVIRRFSRYFCEAFWHRPAIELFPARRHEKEEDAAKTAESWMIFGLYFRKARLYKKKGGGGNVVKLSFFLHNS